MAEQLYVIPPGGPVAVANLSAPFRWHHHRPTAMGRDCDRGRGLAIKKTKLPSTKTVLSSPNARETGGEAAQPEQPGPAPRARQEVGPAQRARRPA